MKTYRDRLRGLPIEVLKDRLSHQRKIVLLAQNELEILLEVLKEMESR